jgi:hypothetical protein
MPSPRATRGAEGRPTSDASSRSTKRSARPAPGALERDFVAFLDAYDLPRPKVNRVTDHGELDATWPAHKLVVEVDGWPPTARGGRSRPTGHGTGRSSSPARA